MRLMVRGTWPGPLTLRKGWARADARPWNDVHLDGHLRLVRGGASFLDDCASELLALGAPSVISPPLPASAQRSWLAAGFTEDLQLDLLRLELQTAPSGPDHLVVEAGDDDLSRVLGIDRRAFDDFWRLDERGLVEAMDATPRSELLVIRSSDGGICGFAILGLGSALAYLQRVAVDPDWHGNGMGRSLVRAVGRRARASGAGAVLLNTQNNNESARRLYDSEGYVVMPEPLALLRRRS